MMNARNSLVRKSNSFVFEITFSVIIEGLDDSASVESRLRRLEEKVLKKAG